jgi:hypothetical protein
MGGEGCIPYIDITVAWIDDASCGLMLRPPDEGGDFMRRWIFRPVNTALLPWDEGEFSATILPRHYPRANLQSQDAT